MSRHICYIGMARKAGKERNMKAGIVYTSTLPEPSKTVKRRAGYVTSGAAALRKAEEEKGLC